MAITPEFHLFLRRKTTGLRYFHYLSGILLFALLLFRFAIPYSTVANALFGGMIGKRQVIRNIVWICKGYQPNTRT